MIGFSLAAMFLTAVILAICAQFATADRSRRNIADYIGMLFIVVFLIELVVFVVGVLAKIAQFFIS